MVVYIEYAFLENCVLDGILLYLAGKIAKLPFHLKRWLLATALGGTFAVLFPFLRLSEFYATVLKVSVGACMCLFLFGRIKSKKAWGRYVLTCVYFFILTAFFAGMLTFFGVGAAWSGLGFVSLGVGVTVFLRYMRAKRVQNDFLYECEVRCGQKRARVWGFYDSGNCALHKNTPVCFVSPDVFYELFGEDIISNTAGQVCDEIAVSTVSGKKNVRLCKGGIKLWTREGKTREKEVYFGVGVNMLSREYKILLSSRIFEEEQGNER